VIFTLENTFFFSCAGNHTISLLATVGLVGLLHILYDLCL